MARTSTVARCTACGHVEPRWMGRCPSCEAWGTLHEQAPVAAVSVSQTRRAAAVPISAVPRGVDQRTATGLPELDRVLGGGLVSGSVTLVGGEPGAGKSTLLLQAAHAMARSGRTVLYVSAEESPAQVRLRADRLGTLCDELLLASESDLSAIFHLVERHAPALLVLDSIQTVSESSVGGVAGGLSQVRACAAELTAVAKARQMSTVLVGHVTKDGQLAGPRVLEHLVDTVCELDGDRHHALRLLRATKNRFGPVGEVGCFEMTGSGMVDVPDAGRLFMGDLVASTSGVAVTLTCEGRRPLACEVQALVAETNLTNPRRTASGLDAQRLNLLLAVLEQRAQVRFTNCDVYVSSVGGLRVTEPAADLALCLALVSSRCLVALPRAQIAIGEVGLAGELRMVAQIERRLAEAGRLGFRAALLPAAYDGPAHGLQLLRAPHLAGALAQCFSADASPAQSGNDGST